MNYPNLPSSFCLGDGLYAMIKTDGAKNDADEHGNHREPVLGRGAHFFAERYRSAAAMAGVTRAKQEA